MESKSKRKVFREEDHNAPKIKVYDFRRPDKFSKEQIRTFHIVHETFCRSASGALSASLRAPVTLAMSGVDQMTYEEFLASIPEKARRKIIAMNPLICPSLFTVDPELYRAMVDRVFGGAGEAGDEWTETGLSQGPALIRSPMERIASQAIFKEFIPGLNDAWSNLVKLDASIVDPEGNTRYQEIVPPRDMIILASMKCTMGEVEGFMNFCVPFLTVEPILHTLSAKWWYSYSGKRTPESRRRIPDLPIETSVCVDLPGMSLQDIQAVLDGKPVVLDSAPYLEAGGEKLFELEEAKDGYRITKALASDIDTREKEEARDSGAIKALAEELGSFKRYLVSRLDRLETSVPEINEALEAVEPLDKPFGFLANAETQDLALVLTEEHPQAVALVLSYLQPRQAARLLERYPADSQYDIICRISQLDRVRPDLLREFERAVLMKLRQVDSRELNRAGGLGTVVDILSHCPRSVERSVIERLEREKPELSESVKQHMFVFEDITLLEKEDLHRVLDRIDRKDLLLAMKLVDKKVTETILQALNPEERNAFTRDLEALGRVKLTEVEAAQLRIVNTTIKNMEESGEIVIARPGELV